MNITFEGTACDEVLFSKQSETEGFDIQAGQTWVYPTNYSARDYQFNIIQEALLKNTLVSLPTGLGKTFIAAVIMYNFYRWYPMGKVVFMAPTRPLVKQQIDACYNIMAIPKDVTAELTGSKIQTLRAEIWQEKRVFFITPQVLQNDLNSLPELGIKIKCLIFDEAHKAKGNHAYCEVVRKLLTVNKHFRVLALSATPGSSVNDVIEVTRNLLITHLELRTDDSADVAPYIFERSLETIVVPLGEKLQEVKKNYIQVLEKYTRLLIENKIIHGNCSTLTKGKIFMTLKEFQEKNKHNRGSAYGDITRNLNICITLYHGYELLIKHGLRGFLNFIQEHSEKTLLRGNIALINIMRDVQEYLGPKPIVDLLPDGTIPQISPDTKFGHPKFYRLRDILLSHFSQCDDNSSRVIVFCEYRESVIEAYSLVIQHKPLLKPRIFLGQSSITQKQQINAVKAFRQGECNILISTCIGEEGLDVGNVDLIICFDVSNKSPIRMVQRMGRTGRKREGRVIVLVTEGKEQQTLKDCLIQKHYLSSNILQSNELNRHMYKDNPRMIPENITPKCQKIFITVQKSLPKTSGNLKDMFNNMARSDSPTLSQTFTNLEILETEDRIPTPNYYWCKDAPLDIQRDRTKIDFSRKIEKLRILQPIGTIGHSSNTDILVSLLQFADSKRYNIPVTQMPKSMPTQAKRTKFEKSDSLGNLKQVDIRTLFFNSKSSTASEEVHSDIAKKNEIPETQINLTKRNVDNDLINELHREITNYMSISLSEVNSCKICDNLCECLLVNNDITSINVKEWVQPDMSVMDNINADNLKMFAESLNNKHSSNNTDLNDFDYFEALGDIIDSSDQKINEITESNKAISDSNLCSISFAFQPPKNVEKILRKCDVSISADDSFCNADFSQIEKNNRKMEKNVPNEISVNTQFSQFQNEITSRQGNQLSSTMFGNLHDTPKNKSFEHTLLEYQSSLHFFKLNSLEDLFVPLNDDAKASKTDSDVSITYSPVLLKSPHKSNSCRSITDDDGSPVLCTFDRIRHLKHKVNKKLFSTNKEKNIGHNISNNGHLSYELSNDKKNENSKQFFNSSDDSISESNNLTGIKNKPNLTSLKKHQHTSFYVPKSKLSSKLDDDRSPLKNYTKKIETVSVASTYKQSNDNVNDFINGNGKNKNECDNNGVNKNYIEELALNINEFCDLSIFGLDVNRIKCTEKMSNAIVNENFTSKLTPSQPTQMNKNNFTLTDSQDLFDSFSDNVEDEKSQKNNSAIGNVDSICDLSIFGFSTRNHDEIVCSKDDKVIVNSQTNIKVNNYITSDIKYSKENNNHVQKNMQIDDICDLPAFGLHVENSQHKNDRKSICKNKQKTTNVDKILESENETGVHNVCDLSIFGIVSQNDKQKYNSSPTFTSNKKLLVSNDMKDLSPVMNNTYFHKLNTSLSHISIPKKISMIKMDNKTEMLENINAIVGKYMATQYAGTVDLTESDIDSPIKNNTKTKQNQTSSQLLNTQMVPEGASTSVQKVNTNQSFSPLSKHNSTSIMSFLEDKNSFNEDSFTFVRKKSCQKPRNLFSTPEKVSKQRNNVIKNKQISQKRNNFNAKDINLGDSDDDFVISPVKTNECIQLKRKQIEATPPPVGMKKMQMKKKKIVECPFIENEAILSSDENATPDSEAEGGSSQDMLEASFVNDDTIDIANTTDIQAQYLQSVRSPHLNRGVFKIPRKPVMNMNVFSQEVDYGDNTYVNDSFCVEDTDLTQGNTQLSELERAEMKLKERRKKKKKKLLCQNNVHKSKRQRIIDIPSDDSD